MRPLIAAALASFALLPACGSDESGDLDVSVCDPANGPFSLTIDNPYLPLPVGKHIELTGRVDRIDYYDDYLVTDETLEIAGVMTRLLKIEANQDGALTMIKETFVAQAANGTVCHFGDNVDRYDGALLVGHRGEWRAGLHEAKPGIMMPAHPEAGMTFFQELAGDDAQDHVEILEVGEQFSVPNRTFGDTVDTVETSPIDPELNVSKRYARGTGIIVSGPLNITSEH